jgi:hypothetical protein
MKKEELFKLAGAYDADHSEENLNAMKDFLKKNTIYFRKYYKNTEGRDPITLNNYQENGRFIDFTDSKQFNIPSLLTVQKQDGENVYVGLSDFIFE